MIEVIPRPPVCVLEARASTTEMVPHERHLRTSEPQMVVLDPPDPDKGALACRTPEE